MSDKPDKFNRYLSCLVIASGPLAILAHRAALWQIESLQAQLGNQQLPTLITGLLSDNSLIALLLILMLGFLRLGRRYHWSVITNTLAGFLGLGLWLVGAMHLRYVEYFGSTFDPIHSSFFATPSTFREGMVLTMTSPLPRYYLIIGLAATLLLALVFAASQLSLKRSRFLKLASAMTAIAIVSHAAVIQLRKKNLHAELIYNPIYAYLLKAKHRNTQQSDPAFATADLRNLRTDLKMQRAWHEAAAYFPFWQRSLDRDAPASKKHAEVEVSLRDFLQREAKQHGPWNIIIVMQESLRAKELIGFADPGTVSAATTPHLARSFAKSISFTETLATADMTHLGQAAVQCSLYSLPGFSLLPNYPQTNVRCLTDIFAQKDYQTYFISGGDNRFDNQSVFYPAHATVVVDGIDSYPYETPNGNWGISDHIMLDRAIDLLAAATKPVFATILTASFHLPHRLPRGTPDHIKNAELSPRERLRAYVDWSWGRFYARISSELPHSLLIMVADQGVRYASEPAPTPTDSFRKVRDYYRIPFAFLSPKMPPELEGVRLANLASLVDVAPTLLALLGEQELPNQFMGQNAFRRSEPVVINWGWRWYLLEPGRLHDPAPLDPRPFAGAAKEAAWTAWLHFDRIAPRLSSPLAKANETIN